MAAHEAAVADLYLACARIYPELADLFQSLAKAEQDHAKSIADFVAKIKEGSAQIPPDRLDSQVVLTSLDSVQEILKEVRRGEIDRDDILAKCVELEETLLEKHCFDVVESDTPDLRQLLQKLSADTATHRDELRQALEGTTGPQS
jgi:rubrerythrin